MLDEPTSSLDPEGARDLRARVRSLAAEGVGVLLSSHDMAEIEDLCTALTILHRGEVAFSGTIEELRKQAPVAVHRLRTSDDARALSIGGAEVAAAGEREGLDVRAGEVDLDAYVIALGRAGIAVRSMEGKERSLESLFLRLTADDADDADPRAPVSPPPDREPPLPAAAASACTVHGVLAVARGEYGKLAAQLKSWAVLATCLAAPFAFAAAIELQSSLPEDTLFGRSVKSSGFACRSSCSGSPRRGRSRCSTSVVGGDVFSSEDRYGTWPTLLTRSRSRAELFAGKLAAALAFSVAGRPRFGDWEPAAGVARRRSSAARRSVRHRDWQPGRALRDGRRSWGSVLPPVLAFTALAVLVSVATRSSAAGMGLPVLIGLAMELSSLLDVPLAWRRVLLAPAFTAWHGLVHGARVLRAARLGHGHQRRLLRGSPGGRLPDGAPARHGALTCDARGSARCSQPPSWPCSSLRR